MNNISILDCSLRDGGFLNNFTFGHDIMLSIFDRLVLSNMDFVEVGYLDKSQEFNHDRTIQPNTDCYNKIYNNVDKLNSKILAIIDYGKCDIGNIEHKSNKTFLDGIRITFKQSEITQALSFAQKIKEKGYIVFLQILSITRYSDRDILDFCDEANKINPYAVSIVDTYGLLHKEGILRYLDLLDNNLIKNIKLGYHSHNNFQLGYANGIEFIQKANRDVVIDGTVYGMGKSAGNAPLELLAMHLNEKYSKNYDIGQILEIIDTHILDFCGKQKWGYSLKFFLAASNGCHPNYIDFLLNKNTLSVNSINEIARNILKDKKLSYDEKYINELYFEYQTKISKKENFKNDLEKKFNDKTILLLGPGRSLVNEKSRILDFINENEMLVIAVNCIPDDIKSDMVFISNSKRYNIFYRKLLNFQGKLICTSNITESFKKFDYNLNYADLLDENEFIRDNSLAIFLNFLKTTNTKKIFLAGFDGHSKDLEQNYYNDFVKLSSNNKILDDLNNALKNKIEKLSKNINIEFITKSIYKD